MIPNCVRALARPTALVFGLLTWPSLAATANPLSLQQSRELAVQAQPRLDALAAQARAARQRAAAAAELPDPSLTLGVSEIPLNTADRFSLRRDGDTDLMVGLRQAFPRAEKRRLRQQLGELQARALDAQRDEATWQLGRQAGLAWLDLWEQRSAEDLLRRIRDEAARQADDAQIRFRAGDLDQADWLAAQVERERLEDRMAQARQQADNARHRLARWIGDAAYGEIDRALPDPAPPEATQLIAGLRRHPHLLADAQRVAMAETGIELARQAYRPDWAVSLAFGYRPALSEMGTLQLEIPLPVYTGRRQDRELEAARISAEAESLALEDRLREHAADIRADADDWQALQGRLERYRQVLLPRTRTRIQAATAAYAAGETELATVLRARRDLLDLELEQLRLRAASARAQVRLDYFAPQSAPRSAPRSRPRAQP